MLDLLVQVYYSIQPEEIQLYVTLRELTECIG